MGREQREIYLFIYDENKQYYRATQDAFGNYVITKNGQPYPIKYNPSNLTNSAIEFATNTKYFSLNRSISYPLSFIKDGAAILRSLYYNGKGIEQKAYLICVEWDGSKYILSYTGKFDFSQKNEDPKSGVFTVPTIDDSAWGVLSNNDTVQFQIDCSPSNSKAIKILVDGINLLNRYTYQTVNAQVRTTSDGRYHLIPFVLVNQDGDSSGVISKSQTGQAIPDFPTLILSPGFALESIYPVNNANIQGSVTFEVGTGINVASGCQLFFYTSLGNRYDIFVQNLGYLNAGDIRTVNYNFNINLADGENLYLVADYNSALLDPDFYITFIVTNTFITIKTRPQPQIVYGLRPLDLLQAVVSKATNNRYTIQSNYFQENNKHICLSGDSIRGIPQSVLFTSFEDLFQSLDPIHFLALRIINGDLWIEPADTVYSQDSIIMDLGDAIDCMIESASEYYANELEVGSPNQDFRHPSGRLEVNSLNTFSLPFQTISKKLSVVTKYRTGCYDIQFLILDYQGQSTQDNTGDKSVYMLDVSDDVAYAQESVETFVDVNINNAPLAPIIKTPLTNDQISFTTPVIRGVSTPLATVNIYADNAFDGTTVADANGNWSHVLVNPLQPFVFPTHTGIHVIDATYTDESAPKTSITLLIDTRTNTPVIIITPQIGDSIYDNKPLIKGTAQQGTVVNVSVDSISLGTVTADESCKWQIQVLNPLTNNVHRVTANGVTNQFTVYSFVAFPLITKINGIPLDTFPIINNLPLIEGVAVPGTVVDIWLNYITYKELGQATADAKGNWSYQVIPLVYPDPLTNTNVVLAPIQNGVNVLSTELINQVVGVNVSGFKLNRPAYSSITGVTDNTVFNTEFSPKRMILARRSLFSSILNQQQDENIYFQTASKNENQVTVLSGTTVSERADVPASSLGNPLMLLEYVRLKTRVPKTFNTLLYDFNNGGLVKFNFRGNDIYCLPIGSMRQSNIKDDVQEWRLLISPKTSYNTLLNLYKNGLTITLMKNSLYHSDYNSLHLVTYNFAQDAKYNNKALYDDWFNNRNDAWALNPDYIQKFQKTETIIDQIITLGLGGSGKELRLQMYRCSDAVLVDTIDYVAVSPAPIPGASGIVYEASINFGSYPEDQYFFVLTVGDELQVGISERVETKTNWEGTILIESTNSINKTGAFFSTGFKSIFRVEGLIKKLQPSLDINIATDENADNELLYSINSRKRAIRFGTAYGLPDYLYLKIADSLALDNLLIEGVKYTLDKDEKIESSEDIPAHPLYYYNINMTLSSNVFGKTMPGGDGAITDGVILVVDATAFGLPAGGLINIEIDG